MLCHRPGAAGLGAFIALLIACCGTWIMDPADITAAVQARSQLVDQQWDRRFVLCRCTVCNPDRLPPHERTLFVHKTTASKHKANPCETQGELQWYQPAELIILHKRALQHPSQAQAEGSDLRSSRPDLDGTPLSVPSPGSQGTPVPAVTLTSRVRRTRRAALRQLPCPLALGFSCRFCEH